MILHYGDNYNCLWCDPENLACLSLVFTITVGGSDLDDLDDDDEDYYLNSNDDEEEEDFYEDDNDADDLAVIQFS